MLADGESVFFQNVVVPGKPATSCSKTTHPRLYGQLKLDLMNVCVCGGGRHKVGSVKKEGYSWQSLGNGYNKYESNPLHEILKEPIRIISLKKLYFLISSIFWGKFHT